MYQPSPSRLTVALRTTPPSGRDSRNRTHPTFGSHTCPHLRFSFWTLTAWPGNGIASRLWRFLNVGGPAGCRGVPPVVVGTVELAQHLLCRLRRQASQPGKLSASQGELEALCVGSQRHHAVAVEVLPLLHCQVPNRPTGMSPPGRHLYLVPSPDPDA